MPRRISHSGDERLLYLAINEEAMTTVLEQAFGRIVAENAVLRLLVVDVHGARIVQWKHVPSSKR
jgi:hypothetical protein